MGRIAVRAGHRRRDHEPPAPVTDLPAICRPELPDDAPAIAALVTAAFGNPAEAGLVDALRRASALVLSLVATSHGEVVGHVALSPVEVAGKPGQRRWLGLGPLAVAPALQRRGIGKALVRRALELAGEGGAAAVFVLGDPHYYGGLGFDAAAPLGWRCAYDAPEPAFRVCRLGDPAQLPPPGTVLYHPAFDAL